MFDLKPVQRRAPPRSHCKASCQPTQPPPTYTLRILNSPGFQPYTLASRYEARNPNEAYKAIEAMRRRGIILSPYLDTRMVEDIYRSLGVALDMAEERRGPANLGLRESDAGAFVEEEVADEDD